MIGRLSGLVSTEAGDGAIVVDVGGVGYEVFVPLGAVGRAATGSDGKATFFVHTHVREDAFILFGFATETDRLAFRTLIGVSSVGPKTALAVLSALPSAELARAIATKDVGKLTSISGIGKKTAERLLLELRDKLPILDVPGGATRAAAKAGPPGEAKSKELLLGALTRMGYRPAEAERAITALGDRVDEAPLAELVKEALAVLVR